MVRVPPLLTVEEKVMEFERGLIVDDARRAGQHQHAGGGVVAAADTVLVGEVEGIIAGDEAGTDRHRGAGEVTATVAIADGQGGVQRDRRAAELIAHRGAGRDSRGDMHGVERAGDGGT